MPTSFDFSIPLGWKSRAEKLRFALEYGLGLEVCAFASGAAVKETSTRKAMERELSIMLRDLARPASYHAAFIDLAIHSEDAAVAEISRNRVRRDLHTASRLGCDTVVVHTGFNPLVPVPSYEERLYSEHAAFWPAVAEEFPGVTVCLENMWEPRPDIMLDLVRGIGHPRVQPCLDVAHAHAYGLTPPEAWIEQLAPFTMHMHWNDNLGDRDTHLALGEGSIDWKAIVAATHRCIGQPTVVLELKSPQALRRSLDFLQALNRPGAEANQAGAVVLPASYSR